MTSQPRLVDGLGLRIGIGAVKEDSLSCKLGFLEEFTEILLSPPTLGEDDGLLTTASPTGLIKPAMESCEQNFSLGIFDNGFR